MHESRYFISREHSIESKKEYYRQNIQKIGKNNTRGLGFIGIYKIGNIMGVYKKEMGGFK